MASSKVFVGNLSFKTREADLEREFSAVGKVVSVNIIANGPRSLGYGFVEFDNPESAARAVERMNHKEIDSRPINVELAHPRDPNAPARRPRFPRQPPRFGFMPPFGMPMGYMNMMGRPDYFGVPQTSQPAPPPQQTQQVMPPQQAVMPPQMQAMPQMQQMAQMPYMVPQMMMMPQRFPRRLRQRTQPAASRTPSKTTLFIGNLPYVVEDETLREIFNEFNVKEARVMKRPDGQSKGFGFVELASEDDQTRALQVLDKVVIENRNIFIQPALSEPFRKPLVTTTSRTVAPGATGEPPKTESH
ncbi:RRM domain [Pelomyxa schiedti]|nr:RRM domain [Pelomyxa schiedti]